MQVLMCGAKMFNELWELKGMRQAGTAETYLIMFIGEAIATVVRNHHRHLDRSPTDA
jgi:hypothetical protein